MSVTVDTALNRNPRVPQHPRKPHRSGWTALPTELKLSILRLRLVLAKPITSTTHLSHAKRALLPLALVDRETHALATETYYTLNTFVVAGSKRERMVAYPNPAIGHLVRRLEVRLYVEPIGSMTRADEKTADSIVAGDDDWRFLLRPRGADEEVGGIGGRGRLKRWSRGSSRWQDAFPKLRALRVVLDVQLELFRGDRGPIGHSCFRSSGYLGFDLDSGWWGGGLR
ncbi:hypothetical protein BDV95DRAFT_615702 [Massariosphaeria phaeospora]|uniref:F-box domain-containing protein n=1 Tax=Massariosphaeria phaeospora TaxID=100035 RepID=A0A7C8MDN8_9PLEO|nr:hypothetical protein BDV95DRAFT_615702 [Massariosphaeria phaeospora]